MSVYKHGRTVSERILGVNSDFSHDLSDFSYFYAYFEKKLPNNRNSITLSLFNAGQGLKVHNVPFKLESCTSDWNAFLFSYKHLCTVALGIRSVILLISITFREIPLQVLYPDSESIQNYNATYSYANSSRNRSRLKNHRCKIDP